MEVLQHENDTYKKAIEVKEVELQGERQSIMEIVQEKKNLESILEDCRKESDKKDKKLETIEDELSKSVTETE